MAGAFITVFTVSIHILTTNDIFANTFSKIDHHYWSIPICTLAGAVYFCARTFRDKTIETSADNIIRGIALGIIGSVLLMLVVLISGLLSALFFSPAPIDQRLLAIPAASMSTLTIATIFTPLITGLGLSVYVISDWILTKFSPKL